MSISIFTAQIASLDTIIADLASQKTALQAVVVSNPSVAEMLATKISNLTTNITAIENQKNGIQVKLDKLNVGFTSAEQLILDDINTKFPDRYNNKFNYLLLDASSDERTAFFVDYQACPCDCSRCVVLDAYLN